MAPLAVTIVVQKFGGSSVATPEHIERVAEQIVRRRQQGVRLVVVVSAMAKTTDDLMAMARKLAPDPDRRELDMLVTVGERVTMALLAMAIRARGVEAVSLTGSQSGIVTTTSHTRARIMEVRPFRVEDELERDRVVIVAGYQGVSYQREITTLGRGGSDTTAVALAAALGAEACEIYSDVEGVWTGDPRRVPKSHRIDRLEAETMLDMALHGARVLHADAVAYAADHGVALYARKTGSDGAGTRIQPAAGEDRVHGPEARRGPRWAVTHREQAACLCCPVDGLGSVLEVVRVCGASVEHVWADAVEARLVVSLDEAVTALPPEWSAGGEEASVRASPVAVVSAIGPGIREQPAALASIPAGLPATVVARWATPRGMHFAVPREALAAVLPALHERLLA